MRVAIVNDLAMATETLRRLLLELPGIQVAWTAVDGREAVEKTRSDRPDLILMDMIMPVMDGPEATKQIMRECPCAIVVVTATVGGNAERVYDALSAGALDATETPVVGPDWNAARDTLARKIDQIRRLKGTSSAPCGPQTLAPSSSRTSASPSGVLSGPGGIPASPRAGDRFAGAAISAGIATGPASSGDPPRIVAIGSSTGGPAALAAVLSALPHDFPFAIVVVQHLDASFVPGLVSWLSRETGRRVEIALPGHTARAGVCSVAHGDAHLQLGPGGTFLRALEPSDAIHRPSVDVLFRSIVSARIDPFAAVLLTGMGRDGAQGLLELRGAGWTTIAQDRGTSVVWGMPGTADRIGAAVRTLPLPMIASELMHLAAHAARRRL